MSVEEVCDLSIYQYRYLIEQIGEIVRMFQGLPSKKVDYSDIQKSTEQLRMIVPKVKRK